MDNSDRSRRADLTKSAPGIRASDAERDEITAVLRDALSEGRLTPDEHAERIDAVYRAKTRGELAPIIADLPAPAVPPAAVAASDAREESPTMTAILGGVTRKGRWRVPAHTKVFAVFGGVEIDLTEAVFEQREVVFECNVLFGGVEIRVPENVTLRGQGNGVLGGFDVKEHDAGDPDAPVVYVRGTAVLGGVEAKRRKGKWLRDFKRRLGQ